MTVASLSAEGFLNASPAPEIERRRFAGRKRRALVLTDEGARHPFRATLPGHVTEDLFETPTESLWRLTRDDVRGFASVYFAVFAAVLVFII
ncbi:hypothetical protein [uncultured Erythrobacter sp.]|uniref:hypothetical protein n=1 Tax=uncultured Erythrobacter sp. TaxID=263913 RepID=UPI0026220A11|nr:hypothetical protein [uncultured Erythrobacter sp.]